MSVKQLTAHDSETQKQIVILGHHTGDDSMVRPLSTLHAVRVPLLQYEACTSILQGEASSLWYSTSPEALYLISFALSSATKMQPTCIIRSDERARIAIFVRCGEIDCIGTVDRVSMLHGARLIQIDQSRTLLEVFLKFGQLVSSSRGGMSVGAHLA